MIRPGNAERLADGQNRAVRHARRRRATVRAPPLAGDEETHLDGRVGLAERELERLPGLLDDDLRRFLPASRAVAARAHAGCRRARPACARPTPAGRLRAAQRPRRRRPLRRSARARQRSVPSAARSLSSHAPEAQRPLRRPDSDLSGITVGESNCACEHALRRAFAVRDCPGLTLVFRPRTFRSTHTHSIIAWSRAARSTCPEIEPLHHADQPPSTTTFEPVTYDEASDARKTTAPSASSASSMRPMGTRAVYASRNSRRLVVPHAGEGQGVHAHARARPVGREVAREVEDRGLRDRIRDRLDECLARPPGGTRRGPGRARGARRSKRR